MIFLVNICTIFCTQHKFTENNENKNSSAKSLTNNSKAESFAKNTSRGEINNDGFGLSNSESQGIDRRTQSGGNFGAGMESSFGGNGALAGEELGSLEKAAREGDMGAANSLRRMDAKGKGDDNTLAALANKVNKASTIDAALGEAAGVGGFGEEQIGEDVGSINSKTGIGIDNDKRKFGQSEGVGKEFEGDMGGAQGALSGVAGLGQDKDKANLAMRDAKGLSNAKDLNGSEIEKAGTNNQSPGDPGSDLTSGLAGELGNLSSGGVNSGLAKQAKMMAKPPQDVITGNLGEGTMGQAGHAAGLGNSPPGGGFGGAVAGSRAGDAGGGRIKGAKPDKKRGTTEQNAAEAVKAGEEEGRKNRETSSRPFGPSTGNAKNFGGDAAGKEGFGIGAGDGYNVDKGEGLTGGNGDGLGKGAGGAGGGYDKKRPGSGYGRYGGGPGIFGPNVQGGSFPRSGGIKQGGRGDDKIGLKAIQNALDDLSNDPSKEKTLDDLIKSVGTPDQQKEKPNKKKSKIPKSLKNLVNAMKNAILNDKLNGDLPKILKVLDKKREDDKNRMPSKIVPKFPFKEEPVPEQIPEDTISDTPPFTPEESTPDALTPEEAENNSQTPEGAAVNAQTPEGQKANIQTPEGREANSHTPGGAVANTQTPEGRDANTKTPEGAAANAQTPEGQKANTQTPEGREANSHTPGGAIANSQTPEGRDANTKTPEGAAANAQNPEGQIANTQTPEEAEANSQTPEGAAVNAQTPEGQKANTQTPEGREANSHTPGGAVANTQTPEGRDANTKTPEGAAANAQTPEGQIANTQTPEGRNANSQTPGGAAANAQTPEGQIANSKTPLGRAANDNTPEGKIANAQNMPNSDGSGDKNKSPFEKAKDNLDDEKNFEDDLKDLNNEDDAINDLANGAGKEAEKEALENGMDEEEAAKIGETVAKKVKDKMKKDLEDKLKDKLKNDAIGNQYTDPHAKKVAKNMQNQDPNLSAQKGDMEDLSPKAAAQKIAEETAKAAAENGLLPEEVEKLSNDNAAKAFGDNIKDLAANEALMNGYDPETAEILGESAKQNSLNEGGGRQLTPEEGEDLATKEETIKNSLKNEKDPIKAQMDGIKSALKNKSAKPFEKKDSPTKQMEDDVNDSTISTIPQDAKSIPINNGMIELPLKDTKITKPESEADKLNNVEKQKLQDLLRNKITDKPFDRSPLNSIFTPEGIYNLPENAKDLKIHNGDIVYTPSQKDKIKENGCDEAFLDFVNYGEIPSLPLNQIYYKLLIKNKTLDFKTKSKSKDPCFNPDAASAINVKNGTVNLIPWDSFAKKIKPLITIKKPLPEQMSPEECKYLKNKMQVKKDVIVNPDGSKYLELTPALGIPQKIEIIDDAEIIDETDLYENIVNPNKNEVQINRYVNPSTIDKEVFDKELDFQNKLMRDKNNDFIKKSNVLTKKNSFGKELDNQKTGVRISRKKIIPPKPKIKKQVKIKITKNLKKKEPVLKKITVVKI